MEKDQGLLKDAQGLAAEKTALCEEAWKTQEVMSDGVQDLTEHCNVPTRLGAKYLPGASYLHRSSWQPREQKSQHFPFI